MGAAPDVLVATTGRLDRDDMRVELAGILRALAANGVRAEVADWHDGMVDWAAPGAVLLRMVSMMVSFHMRPPSRKPVAMKNVAVSP